MKKKSGRPYVHPLLKRNTKGMRLAEYISIFVDKLKPSRTEVIEEALIKVHKIKKPTAKELAEYKKD